MYHDWLSDQWGAWQAYWREPSGENREACRETLSAGVIKTGNTGPGPTRTG
jgi:hypothetical protein